MRVQVFTDGEPGTKGLQRKFKALALKSGDRRALLGRIGVQLLNEVTRNFAAEGNEGKAWVPLKAVTLARRRKGPGTGTGKVLQDTGRLKGSFAMAATDRDVRVGSQLIYAPTHEFGDPARHIPQRKMLPHERRGLQLAIDTAEKFIAQRRAAEGL